MGYVFTPKEFEEGRIPNWNNYRTGMNQLKSDLLGLSDKKIIHGANINGSLLYGKIEIGSDADVLAVTISEEAEDCLNELKNDIKTRHYVPVEFVPISKHLAERGQHTIDYVYFQYMQLYCQDGIVGNNPLSLLKPKESWKNPVGEIKEKLEAQLAAFSKMKSAFSLEYDKEDCKFLEKILRQPLYAAIDVIRLKYGGIYPNENGRLLSKGECCVLYKKEFPEADTSNLFTVLNMRKRYRGFLKERNCTTAQYVEMLEEIKAIYPNARNVIEKNLELISG